MRVVAECTRTMRTVCPDVVERYNALGIGVLGGVYDDCVANLERLDARCFDAYIALVGARLKQFVAQAREWDYVQPTAPSGKRSSCGSVRCNAHSVPPSTAEVRVFVKEILTALVLVHANVAAAAADATPRVLCTLVRLVVAELCAMVRQVPAIGPNGLLQLRLDVAALRSTLCHYNPDGACPWLDLCALLVEKTAPSRRRRGRPRRSLPTPGAAGPRRRSLPQPGVAVVSQGSVTSRAAKATSALLARADCPEECADAMTAFRSHTRLLFECFARPP